MELKQLQKDYTKKITKIKSDLSANNKMSRGGFSAIFFLKCIKALDLKRIDISQ